MGVFRYRFQFLICVTTLLLVAPSGFADSKQKTHFIKTLSVSMSVPDVRQWQISNEFMVNQNATIRYVIPDVCEEEGMERLRLLALNAEVEESYVYIPKYCLWIEAGYNESSKKVRLDHEFIDRLLAHIPVISIYHIHVGLPEKVRNYFPAYSDLVSLILINARFMDMSQISISHHATTSLGTISYEFTSKAYAQSLIDTMRRAGLNKYVAQNLAYVYARDTYQQNYYRAVQECERLAKYKPENISDCFPIETRDFVLTYVSGQLFTVLLADE